MPQPTNTSCDGGILVVDKPGGLTSHGVVARLRPLLGTRRVGHAGTLDPMATGVLVVGHGRGTRLLPYLQATTKRYCAGVRLGLATTTDDRTGEPLQPATAVALSAAEIDAGLEMFVGDILQRPSAVSAIKVDGRRAYARVRAGEQVELPPRPVRISDLRRISPPAPAADGCLDFNVELTCTTGTYVRALARDLGEHFGCGGHLTELRRTAVGPFTADQAIALPQPGEAGAPAGRGEGERQGTSVLPGLSLGNAAAAVLPVVQLTPQQAAGAALGQPFPCGRQPPGGPVALLTKQGRLVAIAEGIEGRWVYAAVFASH